MTTIQEHIYHWAPQPPSCPKPGKGSSKVIQSVQERGKSVELETLRKGIQETVQVSRN